MTTKKKTTGSGAGSTALVTTGGRPTLRAMVGGTAPVPVDAIYHVKALRPAAEGPWNDEADKIAWTDPLTGYGCIIKRSSQGGHLGGYVSVPPGHPLFERKIYSLDDHLIGVHGGLNYAAECRHREPEEVSICHIVAGGREVHGRRAAPASTAVVFENAAAAHDDAWWFGFECNTAADVVPDASSRHCLRHDKPWDGVTEPTYKTEAFVYRECSRLAVQMKAIAEGRDPRDADPGPSMADRSAWRRW